jgi:hypothetical protein
MPPTRDAPVALTDAIRIAALRVRRERGLWRAARCAGGCRLGFVDDSPLEGALSSDTDKNPPQPARLEHPLGVGAGAQALPMVLYDAARPC